MRLNRFIQLGNAMVNFWLLVGPLQNWKTALRLSPPIWGVRDTPRLRLSVQKLSKGDLLAFYVMRPVSGIVGFGKVESERFIGDDLIWPDEKKANKVVYPHRFNFSIFHQLEDSAWKTQCFRSYDGAVSRHAFRGFNPMRKETFATFIRKAGKQWSINLQDKLGKIPPEKPVVKIPRKLKPSHDLIKQMVYEIGNFKGKVVEKEYPIDNYRLDVVWKRIVKGNPYRAFEVQVGGNFFEALTKLKHAWDMWNSTPYLVTTGTYIDKAKQLVEGSFHEMGKALKIVNWRKIQELYDARKRVDEIESETSLE